MSSNERVELVKLAWREQHHSREDKLWKELELMVDSCYYNFLKERAFIDEGDIWEDEGDWSEARIHVRRMVMNTMIKMLSEKLTNNELWE